MRVLIINKFLYTSISAAIINITVNLILINKIYDSDLKRVAVYARVSTSSEEQISSIENQTL